MDTSDIDERAVERLASAQHADEEAKTEYRIDRLASAQEANEEAKAEARLDRLADDHMASEDEAADEAAEDQQADEEAKAEARLDRLADDHMALEEHLAADEAAEDLLSAGWSVALKKGTGSRDAPSAFPSSETRFDADGAAYTEAQFATYYGGTTEWDAAASAVLVDNPGGGVTWRCLVEDVRISGVLFVRLTMTRRGDAIIFDAEDDFARWYSCETTWAVVAASFGTANDEPSDGAEALRSFQACLQIKRNAAHNDSRRQGRLEVDQNKCALRQRLALAKSSLQKTPSRRGLDVSNGRSRAAGEYVGPTKAVIHEDEASHPHRFNDEQQYEEERALLYNYILAGVVARNVCTDE